MVDPTPVCRRLVGAPRLKTCLGTGEPAAAMVLRLLKAATGEKSNRLDPTLKVPSAFKREDWAAAMALLRTLDPSEKSDPGGGEPRREGVRDGGGVAREGVQASAFSQGRSYWLSQHERGDSGWSHNELR